MLPFPRYEDLTDISVMGSKIGNTYDRVASAYIIFEYYFRQNK